MFAHKSLIPSSNFPQLTETVLLFLKPANNVSALGKQTGLM